MLKYQDFIEQYSPKYGGLAKKIAIFMEDREISSLMGNELYECFGTKTAIGKTQFYRYRNVLIDFVGGDSVVVIGGVWKDTVGMIQSINENKQCVTINVDLFGRETPVEISFTEIKKM